MKKVYFLIPLFLLLNIPFYAQSSDNSTKITSIQIKGQNIMPSELNTLELTIKDSIRISFNVSYPRIDESSLLFKKILDGKQIDSISGLQASRFVLLKNLKPGEHVFQVNAYTSKGWESEPAILKITVKAAAIAGINEPETIQNSTIISDINMITYILFGVILLLVLIILYLLISRKTGKKSGEKSNVSITENEDYKYLNDKFKKEIKNLQETNSFLKIQIQELKADVKDLEEANVQLVRQKEKLQESKRQLEELQKQKDDLFAIAVHDIKNPASIIKGLIELLTDYDLNAKDQQQIMQSLTETSTRIIDLAQKMAMVCARSKPEPEVVLEPASIKEIIDSVCKRNLAYANNKKIKLINNTSLNLPKLNIDKGKIDEVMDNLINNAIKYGPEETIVQIKSFFNQKKVTVEVADTGVGFSEEDMPNVFQKGVLLSSTPTGGETRSGLGLWIVKKIIEDHGGKITLESKKGLGARFIFELPIKQGSEN